MKTRQKNLIWISLVVGFMVTACQPKNDNNSVVAPAPVYVAVPPCPSCVAVSIPNAGVLISGVGSATALNTQIDVTMDFFGDLTKVNAADPKAIFMYYGQGMLSGTMTIANTGNNGMAICGVYPGSYQMQSQSIGTMSGPNIFGTRMFSASSPSGGVILATAIYALIRNSDDPNGPSKGSSSNRLVLNMRLDSVNGQPCGLTFLTN